LMHGIEKPLFKFTCVFGARYERQGDQSMPWENFTTVMAVTHLVPYLREFVSNVTNRSLAPALILPPINAHALLAEFEKRRQQSNPPLSPSEKPA
jgi:preprotein translocase subunit SecB